MVANRKAVSFNIRFFSSSTRVFTPGRSTVNLARIRPAQAFGRKFSGNVLNYCLPSRVFRRKSLVTAAKSLFRAAPLVSKPHAFKIKRIRKKICGRAIARRYRKAIGKILTRYRKNLLRRGKKSFRKRLRVRKVRA
jgi:hypothetical protein